MVDNILDEYLKETEFIDFSHPSVKGVANRLTEHLSVEREKVCALFSYTRDEIKFGWTSYFSYMKASDVIAAGVGYCNTKSTLFVALLRSIGIPSRQIFLDISCEILHGLGIQSGQFVDHSYTEIFLDGVWLKTDAYVVDRQLFYKSRDRLLIENLKIGYGVHVHGSADWDATGDCFAQYVDDNYFPNLTQTNWGYYQDTKTFYEKASCTHNNFDIFFPLTFLFFLTFYVPNSRVEALRNAILDAN